MAASYLLAGDRGGDSELSPLREDASQILDTGVIADLEGIALREPVQKARAAQITDPEAPVEIHVRHAATGGPVSGAEVYLLDQDTLHPLGASDASGHLIHTPSSAERMERACIIYAKKGGLVSDRISLPRLRSGEPILVKMFAGGALTGKVVYYDGRPAASDVLVIAHHADERFQEPRQVCSSLYSRSPLLPSTETAADGRFVLSGLDPRWSYVLAAAHGAFVALDRQAVKPGADDITLVLAPAYATLLRIVESGGEPVRLSSRYDPGGIIIRHDRPSTGFELMPEWMMCLLGLDPSRLLGDPSTRCFLFTDAGGPPVGGPLSLTCTIPGYVPARDQFFALPLDRGLEEHVVELVPTGEPFGHLDVRFVNLSLSDAWAVNRPRPIAWLRLWRQSEGYTYTLPHISSDPIRLTDVPSGTFHARIESMCSSYRFPAVQGMGVPVSIGASGGTLYIEEPPGMVELSVWDERYDYEYTGPAVFVVGESVDGTSDQMFRWSEVDFARAPYQISGLAAATYFITLRFPKGDGPAVPAEVAVSADTLARGTVLLR